MVCLGNICRSPLAEGIMRDKARIYNLLWQVESVGTSNYNIGHPAHTLSQKVARLHGIDISKHKARQFKMADMIDFDKIYVMDTDNYEDVKQMSNDLWDASKTDLILNALYPGENRSVPDPWYSGEPAYHDVYKMIDKACECIVQSFISSKEYNKN